ncbi:MAG: DNA mismatch repair protein MutS [Firmicutes bacterium]|nr:DNA mismatch repair protein MutS [Alicyclobacillaceae bacterium]MCL6496879.1 DNA mismatch repair protein MutS [Bacillota bacterium]
MAEQYRRLKAEHPEALLLFRLGDFYELFGDDAVTAAPVLEVQLTSRDGVVPMCGVPHHALDHYLRKLMAAGFTVAIAEQTEDPKKAKGLVERRVVRTVSPGTFVPDPEEGQWVPRFAVLVRDRRGWALAVAELATGALYVTEGEGHPIPAVLEEWERWRPEEFLTNWEDLKPQLSGRPVSAGEWFGRRTEAAWEGYLAQRLGTQTLTAWGLGDRPRAQWALYLLVRALEVRQGRPLPHLTVLRVYDWHGGMHLPPRTLRQLDIFSDRGPSLFGHLNHTVTGMGARLLREWLTRPLCDPAAIRRRALAIRFWAEAGALRRRLRETLRGAGDLSRRVSRLVLGLGTPRDLRAVRAAVAAAMALGEWVPAEGLYEALRDEIDPRRWEALAQALDPLAEDPPLRWNDPGLIRPGADARLDRLRRLAADQRAALAELEARERERTQIRSLKVGYHRTLGYYWEVPRSQVGQVPPDWRRRQSMAHSERFTSEALLALEAEIQGAEAESLDREAAMAEAMVAAVREASEGLNRLASALAELDVLGALAEVVVRQGYTWPTILEPGQRMRITGLRHPVLETVLAEYVASDFEPEPEERVTIITGPNMGGKSTFLRALAQVAILAQIGMAVPCEMAALPCFDGIYTRIGADDDLVRGQSTFMVEMEEVAAILRQAGPHSLVILDELGRGTSTFDGMAIAWAVVEYLAGRDGPTTLFATHYHELTELGDRLQTVANRTAEVVPSPQGGVLFTHRILPGKALRSYGIEVARRAGLPPAVLTRAAAVLRRWETAGPQAAPAHAQLTLFAPNPLCEELWAALAALDLDELSPREAWRWLEMWRRRVIGRGAGAS